MNLLIPVDSNDRYTALLTTIEQHNYWAYVELNEGQIVKLDFFKDKKEANCWVDYAIVISENEYIIEFEQNKVSVLLAPTQRSIDEIVEAFLFRELDELKKYD